MNIMTRSLLLSEANRFNRFIHHSRDLPKKTKELILYGNNSLLFSAHEAFLKHGLNKQYKITIINSPFWLMHTHDDFLNENWGQKLYGLSGPARRLLLSHQPHYPIDRFVTWGDYKVLLQQLIQQLKETPKVEIHDGRIQSIIKQNSDWLITLDTQKQIITDKNSFFYGWTRFPRSIKIPFADNSDVIEIPSHTILYSKALAQHPKEIIVLGHGLSVVWLLKHFPSMRVITIRQIGDKLPDVPSNKDVNISQELQNGRLIIIDKTPDIELNIDLNGYAEIYHKNDSDSYLYRAPIYSASGFVPDHSVFAHIPETHKLLMPIFEPGKNLNHSEISLKKDKFIAPKNTPPGSSPHSGTILMELTNNMTWADEPMSYFSEHQHERLFQHLKDIGIQIDSQFFAKIDEEVIELENALSAQESIELYTKYFYDLYNPTPEEKKLFTQVIENLFINNKPIHTAINFFKIHDSKPNSLAIDPTIPLPKKDIS